MTMLKAGDKAPAFSGKDQNNNVVKLSDFKGQKLVIYFYPADMTPTCTVQACNLRDNFGLLRSAGISVLGVSPDDVAKHKKFEDKFDLPFPLLADTSLEIINLFGVWGQKQMYGKSYMGLLRTTFLIDEKGKIKHVFLKPKSKDHSQEILEAWQA